VCIEIIDRGKGFDPAGVSRGKGLANMAARAEALNGAFRCDSAPGAGTVSAIWLPIAQARVGR
jgi:signal transduction histidine kinase